MQRNTYAGFIALLIISSSLWGMDGFDFKKLASTTAARDVHTVAISPQFNNRLFVATTDYGNNRAIIHSIDKTSGKLSPKSETITTGSVPICITFSPVMNNRLFVFIANQEDPSIDICSINEQGALKHIYQITTPDKTTVVATSPVFDRHILISASYTGAIATCKIPEDETFDRTSEERLWLRYNFIENKKLRNITFSPRLLSNNRFLAAAICYGSNRVETYSVTQDRKFQIMGFFHTSSNPSSMAFMPIVNTTCFATITDDQNKNILSSYSFDETTESFSPAEKQITMQPAPYLMAFSPDVVDGHLLAVTIDQAEPNSTSHTIISTHSVRPPIDTDALFGDIKHAAN